MSTHKHFDLICVAVLLCTLLITILFINGESLGLVPIYDGDSEEHSDSSWFTANDRDGAWETAGATRISLKGGSASVSGGGAYFYDGNVVIAQSGRYVISGILDDGSVIVSADGNSKVWILLDGAEISCADDACLRIDQADKVFLTLAEGTDNRFSGGAEYSDTALEDKTGGVIYAHDDLTINGTGSLTLEAAFKHGIDANDDLVITGGSLTVNAAADAIHVHDSFRIENADLTLAAGDDGIRVSTEEGYFYQESGSIGIDAGGDGISTLGNIILAGGEISVTAGDDGIHTESSFSAAGTELAITAGDDGIHAVEELSVTACTLTIDAVNDGLQTEGDLRIDNGELTLKAADNGMNAEGGIVFSDGTLTVDAGGDGIHAAGDIRCEGGKLTIRSEDDGIHSDAAVAVTGGTLLIEKCYEGIEALTIDISGGDVTVYPADDGLNANGGSGDFGFGGFGGHRGGFAMEQSGQNQTAAEAAETWIHISGGTITVVNGSARDADGLDSNGDILISGGTVRVSLNNDGSNNAIDYASESGGVCEISGGNVIACGSYAMAEGFTSGSTQPSIMYNISGGAAAGTTVSLEDANGNVLMSYEVPCSFSSVTMSSPELKLGESYLVVIGEKVEAVTLEEVSASYGNAASEGFFGNMNWGGMRQRDLFEGFGDGSQPELPEGSAAPQPGGGGGRGRFQNTSGELPAPPDGSAVPQPPEDGEMPSPPEGDGMQPAQEQGERPDMMQSTDRAEPQPATEQAQTSGTGNAPAEETGELEAASPEGSAVADESVVPSDEPQPVGAQTWVLLGACFLVLAAGILLAVKYRQ